VVMMINFTVCGKRVEYDDLITVRGGARDDSSDYNKQTYN
jgi:hypothetical protein